MTCVHSTHLLLWIVGETGRGCRPYWSAVHHKLLQLRRHHFQQLQVGGGEAGRVIAAVIEAESLCGVQILAQIEGEGPLHDSAVCSADCGCMSRELCRILLVKRFCVVLVVAHFHPFGIVLPAARCLLLDVLVVVVYPFGHCDLSFRIYSCVCRALIHRTIHTCRFSRQKQKPRPFV